ncbi:MAG: FAD:protein FMN transferase, partial [Phycisphaerae bacterium]|nr:FAD:protein FMN transferase [Phycisphaerae bacterium]
MSGHPGGLRRALAAMGTRFEVVVAGAPGPLAAAAADEAVARIAELHARWSRFDAASVVSGVNRAARARPVRVEAETFALLRLAKGISGASGGAFDPTLSGRMNMVELDEAELTVRFGAPDLALDLGAIAKGAAIDAAAAVLREAGVPGALVHGGTSSVWAVGRDAGGAPWRVR